MFSHILAVFRRVSLIFHTAIISHFKGESMTISSKTLFSTVYNDTLRDIVKHGHERYTFTGGRASCKSSFISLAIIILMMQHKDYNALILRKYANTLRRSVFEQVIWAIDMLGLRKCFAIPKSSTTALPIKLMHKDGSFQTIFFSGCDNPEKIKSLKTARGYFAILWDEEKTEFIPGDLQNVRISALRGGETFYIFESYNPPASSRHWCNLEAKESDKLRRVIHTTYKDIPAEWLGPAIMHDIEHTRQTNDRAYRNIYLGEATGSGELIFENIKERTIAVEEAKTFDYIFAGVDWGYYPDPFSFMLCGYRGARLFILGELVLRKCSNERAFNKVVEYCDKWVAQVLGSNVTNFVKSLHIVADSAEPKSIADFQAFGADIRGAIKGPTSRDASYKWLQSLDEIIIDGARTPHALDEFSLLEHDIDKKTGEIIDGYPTGQSDHCIDAIRYATQKLWNKAGG